MPAPTPGKAPTDLSEEALHARYAPRISRLIKAVLGHDSEREDLVHEVLITVFTRIGTLRDPACLDRWVAQVTMNTIKYTMRRRRVRRHACWHTLPEVETPTRHPDLEGHDLAARALGIIDRLPAKDRSLLLRYWFTRGSTQEIASEAAVSVATMRRRLDKARARFDALARRDPALAKRLADSGKATRVQKLVALSRRSLGERPPESRVQNRTAELSAIRLAV